MTSITIPNGSAPTLILSLATVGGAMLTMYIDGAPVLSIAGDTSAMTELAREVDRIVAEEVGALPPSAMVDPFDEDEDEFWAGAPDLDDVSDEAADQASAGGFFGLRLW